MSRVQYQGATVVLGDTARFSSTSGTGTGTDLQHHRRAPDLILQPCKEGMDFTMRLLAANRMSKVVEIQCDFATTKSSRSDNDEDDDDDGLTDEEDVMTLFRALGGRHDDDDDDDDEDVDDDDDGFEDIAVTDEYEPINRDSIIQAGGGLPYLESLSIICQNVATTTSSSVVGNDDTTTTTTTTTVKSPSFITGLTWFLSSSIKFPRFTRLSLEGVNLQGSSLLEFRALIEAFRLHPRLTRVQMTSCWFTPEQQANMAALQAAFPKQQSQRLSYSSPQNNSTLTNPAAAAAVTTTATPTTTKPIPTNKLYDTTTTETADSSRRSSSNGNGNSSSSPWWGERFLKNCFCWW